MTPKNQILESLDYLDPTQTENVLNYIKGLQKESNDANYQRSKREAMIQIRQAFSNGTNTLPVFGNSAQ